MLSNTKTLALALALGVTASTAALAQAAAPAGSAAGVTSKVGIVGIQQAIAATNEGQQEMAALQKKFAPRQGELKALNDEIEGLKKQYQAQQSKLSDDEKTNRAKIIADKQKTLQRNAEDFQSDVQQAEQEVLNRLGGKMLNVLDKYATANGYSVILDVSSQQTPVLWASQPTNITKALVDAYNAQSPVKPPASPGAAVSRPAGKAVAARKAAPAKRP